MTVKTLEQLNWVYRPCPGLVQRCGGTLDIASTLGGGTTLTVWLPYTTGRGTH